MLHHTGPDPVHVQIEQAPRQVCATLHQRRMEATPPNRAFATLARVVVPGETALQPVHHLGQVRHPRHPQQQVDVIGGDRVVKEPQTPEPPRRLQQTTLILPTVNRELQREFALLTPVRDVYAGSPESVDEEDAWPNCTARQPKRQTIGTTYAPKALLTYQIRYNHCVMRGLYTNVPNSKSPTPVECLNTVCASEDCVHGRIECLVWLRLSAIERPPCRIVEVHVGEMHLVMEIGN